MGQAGRLGNSLFQIAACVGVARRRGTEPRFNADWPYRPWFSIPDGWFTDDFADSVDLEDCAELAHIDPAARGYAQDLSLWVNVADEVRSVLAPAPAAQAVLATQAAFWALPRPALAVHVRRGDNVQANDPLTPDKWRYHPLRPLSYYTEAIGLLRRQAASVAVFSDDPSWCRANLEADYFHEGVARPKENAEDYLTAPILDWVDLFLLASADAFVLSNSTFGLIAAWLSGSTAVTVPWPWYGPALDYIDASLMIPDGWRRVKHPIGPEDTTRC